MEQRAQTLVHIATAMGKQMLLDGVFNGDPHPGTSTTAFIGHPSIRWAIHVCASCGALSRTTANIVCVHG